MDSWQKDQPLQSPWGRDRGPAFRELEGAAGCGGGRGTINDRLCSEFGLFPRRPGSKEGVYAEEGW